MASRPVCEDQLASRQSPDFASKDGVRFEAGAVDIVDKVEKALSKIDMFQHQPA
jgi:hypothetical protein